MKSSMSEEGKLVSIVIHGEQQGNLKGYRLFTMIVRNDLEFKKRNTRKLNIYLKNVICVPPLRSQRLPLKSFLKSRAGCDAPD